MGLENTLIHDLMANNNTQNDLINDNQCNGSKNRTSWNIKSSFFAKKTNNRIRSIVECLKITPNPEKAMIPLSIGDPTKFGNLSASEETILAVRGILQNGKYNGYSACNGNEEARRAIAKYSAHQSSEEIRPENVFITSGCSAALEYSILVLAERGQNILTPRPGFCLYQTLAEGFNIEVRYYNLLPEKQWQIDLKHLETLIDENTAALIINNPSNPCGSVFTKQHLEEILNICEKYYLPIIADEIYEQFVFPGSKHIAISSLSKNVPVLTCSGLAKRFLVPGWRCGWIIAHDREDRLKEVIKGLYKLCSRILGCNTLVQGAIPAIFENTPQSYYDNVIDIISKNAEYVYNKLKQIRGLNPIMPNGAMYMLIGINIDQFPEFNNDTSFVESLVSEQSVFCLPGICFEVKNFIRIVLTVPFEMIQEACKRIADFCTVHHKMDSHMIEINLLNGISY